MIITVTITTITTVTAIAAMGLSGAIGIGAVVSLILFLTTKELAGVAGSGSIPHLGKFHRIATFLNVGILPLLMAFAVIVVVTVAGG